MKQILILEDDKKRIAAFKQYLNIPNSEVTYVETSKDAIKALKSKVYDVVFLDHDLGGKSFVTKVEGTGYEVALFIERMPPEKRPYQVIIHSHNTSGASRIYSALKNSVKMVQIIPFATLLTGLTHKKL